MTSDLAVFLSKHMLWQAMTITAPVILVAVISGLLVSLLQVVTQIQDSTLSTISKLLAVLLMLMVCGGWMLHSLVDFAQTMIIHIPEALK